MGENDTNHDPWTKGAKRREVFRQTFVGKGGFEFAIQKRSTFSDKI